MIVGRAEVGGLIDAFFRLARPAPKEIPMDDDEAQQIVHSLAFMEPVWPVGAGCKNLCVFCWAEDRERGKADAIVHKPDCIWQRARTSFLASADDLSKIALPELYDVTPDEYARLLEKHGYDAPKEAGDEHD